MTNINNYKGSALCTPVLSSTFFGEDSFGGTNYGCEQAHLLPCRATSEIKARFTMVQRSSSFTFDGPLISQKTKVLFLRAFEES